MKVICTTLSFAIALIFVSCQTDSPNKQAIITDEIAEIDPTHGVSIEVSLPNGDSLRTFGLCWDDNPVDVIIRNQTDSVVHFYENWNSWGYFNFKFQIETNDSIYTVNRIKPGGWWKNFPSTHSINPEESLVFHFNLTDSSCINKNRGNERRKGLKQWVGLPQKKYDQAKIKVMYEIPEEDELLFRKRMKNLMEHLEDKNVPLTPTYDTTYIFSEKLISRPINIRIAK